MGTYLENNRGDLMTGNAQYLQHNDIIWPLCTRNVYLLIMRAFPFLL